MKGAQVLLERFKSSDFQHRSALFAGAALAIFGITRKSWSGAGLAGAGVALIFAGLRDHKSATIKVDRSVTINKPAEDLYRFWRNFENLPQFMEHLESVTENGDISHWVIKGPLGKTVEWDTVLNEDQPNHLIRWHSLPNSMIAHSGSVEFKAAPGGRGTVVRVHMRYSPPLGKTGVFLAAALGKSGEQIVREELRHFKSLMEAGEVPTTLGQPAGNSGVKGKTAETLLGERSRQPRKEPLVFRRIRA